MKRLAVSERVTTGLITWTVILTLWLVPPLLVTRRPPDFRFLLSPAFWAGMLPMLCVCAVSRYELRRRKGRALPYLFAYMVAAIFYGMFIIVALSDPRAQVRLDRFGWYLAFTTAVLLLGIVLHRRTLRHPGT